jgi:acetyl-CoA synthetase
MESIEAFKAARQQLLDCRGAPEKAYATFQWPQLDEFNWALDWFDDYAAGNDQPALWLIDADGSEYHYSFEAMRRQSNQVANFLRAQGVARGDRILLMLDNVSELWETMLASIKLGAIMIPSATLASGKELGDRIERGRAKYVVTDGKYASQFPDTVNQLTRIAVGEAPSGWIAYRGAYDESPDFAPDGPTQASDPMLLYFTSGTTSLPKLVLHTHQSYPVGSFTTMYWLGLQPGDIHLNISSPGWAKHAWSCFFAPWDAGATIFIYRTGRFSAEGVLATIAAKGVTSLCAPPTVWRMLVQKDLAAYDMKLKGITSAGEPLNPEIIKHVERAWNLTIREGYGQTETTALIAVPPGLEVRHGSMGRPLPGYNVVLLDPEGNESSEGEIALDLHNERPTGLMQEYSDDPERTQTALHGGYYRTGDVAQRDADGYYWYVGRADDVFKSSDYRISPFELESILIEHESVAEAAVVAAPDPQRLHVPKAYLILREGYEPGEQAAREIFAFTREHMAPYQRIRLLEFADLPKTISGKIRRVELRAHAASGEHNEFAFAESQFF